MYHDTIHINFRNISGPINFEFSFLISKIHSAKLFSPIKYCELLKKFEEINFNLKYLKFNDVDDDAIVYCTYNYQPNFNIFFAAYEQSIRNQNFDITFEYGNIINGKFYKNNMNFFAGVYFIDFIKYEMSKKIEKMYFEEEIIKGKRFLKNSEYYQIIDNEGNIIYREYTDWVTDFEQHFFEKYEVKVALRKYKLLRLQSYE